MCGKAFDGHHRAITCCAKCTDINTKRKKAVYNPEYYRKNWTKWQEYAKKAKKEKVGTGNLPAKMHKTEEGDPDFKAEAKLIKRELVRLNLRYAR